MAGRLHGDTARSAQGSAAELSPDWQGPLMAHVGDAKGHPSPRTTCSGPNTPSPGRIGIGAPRLTPPSVRTECCATATCRKREGSLRPRSVLPLTFGRRRRSPIGRCSVLCQPKASGCLAVGSSIPVNPDSSPRCPARMGTSPTGSTELPANCAVLIRLQQTGQCLSGNPAGKRRSWGAVSFGGHRLIAVVRRMLGQAPRHCSRRG